MGGECELAGECMLFFSDHLEDMPKISEVYRRNYCRKSKNDCARFMICEHMGLQSVPADLFPNDRARAFDVLGKAGHVM